MRGEQKAVIAFLFNAQHWQRYTSHLLPLDFEAPFTDMSLALVKEPARISQHWREIPLTQGKVAIVDAIDYSHLSQWKWHANKSNNIYYYAGRKEGKKMIYMHHEVASLHGDTFHKVVHINSNTLDNRWSNLRLVGNVVKLRPDSVTSLLSGWKHNPKSTINVDKLKELLSEIGFEEVHRLKSQRLKVAFLLAEVLAEARNITNVPVSELPKAWNSVMAQIEEAVRVMKP